MYDYICQKCGGLVPEPMKAYGYSGRYCHCETPTLPIKTVEVMKASTIFEGDNSSLKKTFEEATGGDEFEQFLNKYPTKTIGQHHYVGSRGLKSFIKKNFVSKDKVKKLIAAIRELHPRHLGQGGGICHMCGIVDGLQDLLDSNLK